jgi:hypothetical protein
MPTGRDDVRFQGKTEIGGGGENDAIDPGYVKTRARGEQTELRSLFLLSAVSAEAVLSLFNVFETTILRENLTSEFSHNPDPGRTSGPGSIRYTLGC